MDASQSLTLVEYGGVLLSLGLLVVGVAELADAVDFLPVSVYILFLWLIALFLWVYRHQRE